MKLNVIGKTTIHGKEINHIEGGFGEGQKVILARDVAEIHGVRQNDINDLIINNIKNYNENMLVNLLEVDLEFETDTVGLEIKTSNRQKYAYLLSEQGYMLLVSSMSNDNSKKWEIMGKFITDYFQMRKELKEEKLDSYMIDDRIKRAERWIEEETIRIEQAKQLQIQKPKVNYYDNVLDTESALTTTQIAKSIGLSAKRLNEILHELRVQYKKGTQWFLYSNYQDKGYTVDGTYLDEGNNTTYHSTKWTEKGKEFILTLLEDEGHIEL